MRPDSTSHFWLGTFDSEDNFFDFVGEDEAYYSAGDHEKSFLSPFIRSQGENWYDHDFMESGFNSDAEPLDAWLGLFSYAEEWKEELQKRMAAAGLQNINAIVFIDVEEIENPVSVQMPGFTLTYLGQITYPI